MSSSGKRVDLHYKLEPWRPLEQMAERVTGWMMVFDVHFTSFGSVQAAQTKGFLGSSNAFYSTGPLIDKLNLADPGLDSLSGALV